jgi:hypothetical protein
MRVSTIIKADSTVLLNKIAHPFIGLFIVTLISGFALRLWGIGFGLPYRYHIDEQGWIAYAGLLCSGQFNFPPWTAGPTFFHISLCGGDILLFVIGRLGGTWHSVSEFKAFYDADPTLVYLVGRTFNALVGTATVGTIYLLGKRLWNMRVGAIAAALLAFNYLHVRDSHFVVSDILTTFLLTTGLLFAAAAMQNSRLRDFAVGGLCAGIATGIKSTFVFAVFPLALAYFLSFEGFSLTKSLTSAKAQRTIPVLAGSFFFGFILGYPNIFKVFFDFPQLIVDFRAMWDGAQIRSNLWEVDKLPGWLFYIKALSVGMGIPLAILAVIGIGYALIKHTRADLLLLSFSIPFYLFMGTRLYYTAHYILPLFPLLILFAARFLDGQVGNRKISVINERVLVAMSVILIALPSVLAIVRTNFLFGQTDTRTLAKEWIEANIPPSAKIATSLYAFWEPPLSTKENPQPDSARSYAVTSVGGLGGLSDVRFEEYQKQGFDYLVISSYVYDIALRDPKRQCERQIFFEKLETHSKLVYIVKPFRGDIKPEFEYDQIYGPWTSLQAFERPGPVIKIYQLLDQEP